MSCLPSTAVAADCNSNGVDDSTDIVLGTSRDCNLNDSPDDCEIQNVFSDLQLISSTAIGANCVLAADLDGDGFVDVLSSSNFDSKIAWYRNIDGHGTFGIPQVISLTALGPESIFATDMDGDGDVDVLAASGTQDKIAWYENLDGLGTFGPEQVITTNADFAQSVIAADLDGDGDPDVLSASAGDNKIAWYENIDGQGAFGGKNVINSSAVLAHSVFAADLDSDGDMDVVYDDSTGDGSIRWSENLEGNGTFGPPMTITTAVVGPVSVYAADLDGDGDVDVLSTSLTDDKIAWYENLDWNGTFGVQQVISTAADFPMSVFCADLDHDGDPDVLSASERDDKIAWYENQIGQAGADADGFGPANVITMLAAGANTVYAADLDGDGDADVLSSSRETNNYKIAWYENIALNDCNGNRVPDDCDVTGATSSDCNGNDTPDECELTGADCNQNSVPDECDIAGTTSNDCDANDIPDECELVANDCNSNGVPDNCELINNDCNANSHPDECELVGNDCNGNEIPDDCEIAGLTSSDCNDNGTPDACEIAAGSSGDCNANDVLDECEIALTYSEQQIISTSADYARMVIAGDIDGDGDADAVSASYDGDTLAWYQNTDGKGTFSPPKIISTTAEHPYSIFAVDLDGDSDLDLLSGSGQFGRIVWYENTNGNGYFGPRIDIDIAGAGNGRSLYAADLDGDGDNDFLAVGSSDNSITWYENVDGLGNFGPELVITNSAQYARAVTAADLDGDGDLDAISAARTDDEIAWYENQIDVSGGGIDGFGPARSITTDADAAVAVFAADIDGDGDTDVVSASENDDKIAWYENVNGLGTFGPQKVISTSANGPQSIFVSDLDQDGDVDVLSASLFDAKIAWYENLISAGGGGLDGFGPQQVISSDALGGVSVFAIDINGDSSPDVLSASQSDDKIAWYAVSEVNDCNDNNVPDDCDIALSTSLDCDHNDIPDECQLTGNDCNFNDTPDNCDIAQLTSPDIDTNGIPDECEPDCNLNGLPDTHDIASGTSADANTNSVPDECETDCDGTGVPDIYEIASGASADCNANDIPDDCEISEGTAKDCNLNFIPDDCEIEIVYSAPNVITSSADSVRSVVAVDLDGDGDADALTASAYDDTIAWYKNTDGMGTFGSKQIITSSADGASFAVAVDLDGDGDLDVISSASNNNIIAWFENTDGRGTFGTQQVISTQADYPFALATADLDGDGDSDVLSASYGDHKIAWYENTDGQGNFAMQQVITTTAYHARVVATADLDGDGDLDVLSASSNDDKIAWYKNLDGEGSFGPQQIISTSADVVLTLTVADLDQDGDSDVISTSANRAVAWFENLDGAGSFNQPRLIATTIEQTRSVMSVDIDGDGDPDVVASSTESTNNNHVVWYENMIREGGGGNDGFGARKVIHSQIYEVGSLYATDVDNDGDADILATSFNNDTLTWFENTAVNDCNNNRIPDDCDIASATSTDCDANNIPDECEVLGNDCNFNGIFDQCDVAFSTSFDCDENLVPDECEFAIQFSGVHTVTTTNSFVRSLFAADLDNDGDIDLISASATNDSITWYENTDSLGSFGAEWIITMPAQNAASVFVADLDGDQDMDVLSASSSDDTVAWYANLINSNGGGPDGFSDKKPITTDADGALSVIAADLDGDGDMDAIAASSGSSSIAWHENIDGLGDFGIANNITNNVVGTPSLFAADLDGDGDADVISGSSTDDKVAWYENADGLGGFGPQRIISGSANNVSSVFAIDIDGDGDNDVLCVAAGDDTIAWYENLDGLGTFSSAHVITSTANGPIAALAYDMDKDGDTDVVAALVGAGTIVWYENIDTKGAFGPQQIITDSAFIPLAMLAADIDGDMDLDVVAPTTGSTTIGWFENQTPNDCDNNRIQDDCESDLDGDGLIDACDSCAGGIGSGDVDANGVIDLTDFAQFAQCLDGPNMSSNVDCECFDLDSDGDNDLQDFLMFQRAMN